MSPPVSDAPRRTGPGAPADQRVLFACAIAVLQGVVSVLEGVAALARDDVYVLVGSYAFKFSLTGWGWIQVILGAALLLSGLGLALGVVWARFTMIGFASLSIIAGFMFLPYQPVWSVIVTAMGVLVLWSLITAHIHEVSSD